MSCADFVPLGSQISVSLGGKTDVCAIPARHSGIGAIRTGLALPCPDDRISPDSRDVAHLEESRSPPRPRTAAGPSLKVSQNACALKLQFADGTNVVDWAKAEEISTKSESAIIKASGHIVRFMLKLFLCYVSSLVWVPDKAPHLSVSAIACDQGQH
jgi:hypothetical protein